MRVYKEIVMLFEKSGSVTSKISAPASSLLACPDNFIY